MMELKGNTGRIMIVFVKDYNLITRQNPYLLRFLPFFYVVKKFDILHKRNKKINTILKKFSSL